MLTIALTVFAIAALGGVFLAVHVLRGQLAPWPISLLHAALGAAGLVILLLVVLDSARPLATWALGLLAVAALGGFFLASMHLRSKVAPKAVVGLHALLAMAGFVMLLAVFLGS